MEYFCCFCKEQLQLKEKGYTSWDSDIYECPNCKAIAIHPNNEEFGNNTPELKFYKK